jgi:hypothetical protein
MARQPKLRKKKIGRSVYWFTKAGGDTYFGNTLEVPYSEAKKQFSQHLQSLVEEHQGNKVKQLTAGDLMDLFLDWVQKHRSDRTYNTRRSHCNRFAAFKVRGSRIAEVPAGKVRGSDLEAWLAQLEAEGQADQTRRHAQTSIKHVWNWATKYPSPTPYLSPTFRPFSSVERIYVSPKALTENDLIADEEWTSTSFTALGQNSLVPKTKTRTFPSVTCSAVTIGRVQGRTSWPNVVWGTFCSARAR